MDFNELWNRFPNDIKTSCENCEQDKRWHTEGSVLNHIKLVFEHAVNNYSSDKEIVLSALFHDLGKPETKEVKEKNGIVIISNIGHELKCFKFIDAYFDLFSDISTNKGKVLEICQNHMKAHQYLDGRLKNKQKRLNFENLEYFDEIIKFSHCDDYGSIKSV